MKDIQSKPEIYKLTNGGKDPNYLVRSWASSLGTVTQGHKAPKSDYRSKWLQRLNRVELMQNVEVQQTLRNMMSTLKASEELLKSSDSAYEFVEKRRIEKCHETVCKIRESESSKRSTRLVTLQSKDELKSKSSTERGKVKQSKQEQTLYLNKSNLPAEYNYTPKTTYFNSDDNYDTFSLHNTVLNGINDNSMSMSDSQAERKISLPPIPERDREKYTAVPRRRCGHQTSLPSLDANSKFSIIKRAREIRNEHHADNKNQNLLSVSSKVTRRFPKARKESLQNYRMSEIFTDNRKILSDQQAAVVENTGPVKLPLLDSKSFSEIDCNDYLNLENRLDGLSPEKAVLDHKLHWPTSSKQK